MNRNEQLEQVIRSFTVGADGELKERKPERASVETPAVAAVPLAPRPPALSIPVGYGALAAGGLLLVIAALTVYAALNRPIATPETVVTSAPVATLAPPAVLSSAGPRPLLPPTPNAQDRLGATKWLLSCSTAPSFLYYDSYRDAYAAAVTYGVTHCAIDEPRGK